MTLCRSEGKLGTAIFVGYIYRFLLLPTSSIKTQISIVELKKNFFYEWIKLTGLVHRKAKVTFIIFL